MKSKRKYILGLAALLLSFSVVVSAQEMSQGSKAQKPNSAEMTGMMKQCREHCMRANKSMQQLDQTVQQAASSNDPKQMREALNEVHTSIAGMQDHMKGCMNMMSMMEKMHGDKGMMGNSGGMMMKGNGMMGGMSQ